MMKRILNFGFILGIVLSSLVLGACGGSDSDDNGVPGSAAAGGGTSAGGEVVNANGRRLVKMMNEGGDITEYIYDSNGRIVTLKDTFIATNLVQLRNYEYTDSKITVTDGQGAFLGCYILENGRVVRDSLPLSNDNGHYYGTYCTYEYDNTGQLTTFKRINVSDSPYQNGTLNAIATYTWQDGNIVKVEGHAGSGPGKSTFTYTYTTYPNILPEFNAPGNVEPFLWSQGFFGKVCKNLLSNTNGTTYRYTFAGGVVTQMEVTYDGFSSVWQLVWE